MRSMRIRAALGCVLLCEARDLGTVNRWWFVFVLQLATVFNTLNGYCNLM